MTNPPKRRATQSAYIKSAVRFPPELHAALLAEAERQGRSFNAQVLAKLQEDELAGLRAEIAELKAMLRKILDVLT